MPLLDVEKAWFWENRYSLLEGLAEIVRTGELVLASAMRCSSCSPPCGSPGSLRCACWNAGTRGSYSALRLLDKWAMADVFVLALVVFEAPRHRDLSDDAYRRPG